MSDLKLAPVCGLHCGSCEYHGEKCPGCGHLDGRPFWTEHLPTGVCPMHDCCRNVKQLEHCGLCEEFPCEIVFKFRDPSWSDEAFNQSLEQRKAALSRRREVGTEVWLREIKSK
ncbi:MAG: DUF3795 domain-containing protein [Pirellulaceae bacterium]|nr:DUF3795 domain-containing protein [Pirellulaceae bacterium]